VERNQPSIDELTARFLSRQSADTSSITACSEVEPYDAVALQPVEPRLAWDGARETLAYFSGSAKPAKPVAGWAQIVNLKPSFVALPMATGHYPQTVRDIGALLAGKIEQASAVDDAGVTETVAKLVASTEPVSWFVAVGILRMAGQFEAASRLIEAKSDRMPSDLADAWKNERATLNWMKGRGNEAKAIWASLPEVAPAAFNLGVAELFAGSPRAAQTHFKKAVGRLPETSGWHHLAQLYLAIAGSR
jgi:hypothetical protein